MGCGQGSDSIVPIQTDNISDSASEAANSQPSHQATAMPKPFPSTKPAPSRPGGLSLDLPAQLAFYGSYHTHPVNQAIHFVCVPAILWSICVWLANLGPLPLPPHLTDPALTAIRSHLPTWVPPTWVAAIQPNAAFLVFAIYSGFYLLLEPFAGLTWSLCVGLPIAWSATVFAGSPLPAALSAVGLAPWSAALAVHVLGWYLQIHPGHAIMERRKPALMDSLAQVGRGFCGRKACLKGREGGQQGAGRMGVVGGLHGR